MIARHLNNFKAKIVSIFRDDGFPELTFDDFKQLDLSPYKWIHFEVMSSNVIIMSPTHHQTRGDKSDLVKMIQRVTEFNHGFPQDKRITISLEFEKYREAVIELMPLADVVSKPPVGF